MKYNSLALIYLSLTMITSCIGMDKAGKDDDPFASYGGKSGHTIFMAERKKGVVAVAATIPEYIQWSVKNGKDLSVCYPKHIGAIGQKRKDMADLTSTPMADQFGLPRENPRANDVYHTPTDAQKHHLLKQTSIASLVTLLTPLVQKPDTAFSVEDSYTKTKLRVLSPDEWPIVVFNEVLHRSGLFKNGQIQFLKEFKETAFYTIFGKMLDVFWEMGSEENIELLRKLIQQNPFMDFKDVSKEGMEAYRKVLRCRDKSLSLLEMEVTLRDPQEGEIPLTKTYCFVPTSPQLSPNGVTEESLALLKSGIFSPFLEHTPRYHFPKLYRVVGRLWKESILLESKTLDSLTTALARLSFVFYNKNPFARGTASIGEIELEGIGLYHQRVNTIPNIVYPIEGLQKLDQVALGSLMFSQYLQHFRNTVKIVTDEKSTPILMTLTDKPSTQQSAKNVDEASRDLSTIPLN